MSGYGIENKSPKAWQLYEEGRNYNQSLTPNQYNLVETNTEFFIGNQWLHLPNTPDQLRRDPAVRPSCLL